MDNLVPLQATRVQRYSTYPPQAMCLDLLHGVGMCLLLLALNAIPAAHAVGSMHGDNREKHSGMVWVPAGEFLMGGVGPEARRDEFPLHRVRLDGFLMDETEVTNRQFMEFVEATGYVTTAERPVDWEELKKDLPQGSERPADDQLAPGSLVFVRPEHFASLRDHRRWWQWKPGANWRHPEGPDSSIDGKEDHPVVQVSYWDALAYAQWTGKRLPTEAQWEYAARGGLKAKTYTWGDSPVTRRKANIWQGEFPYRNTCDDGYATTSPVRAFPKNGYGLYGMAGNVWEWCADLYSPTTYYERVIQMGRHALFNNPKGPSQGYDSRHREARQVRVLRGGSYLCHGSYCASYRPSARMSSSPDTGMPHVGFRCVKDGAPPLLR